MIFHYSVVVPYRDKFDLFQKAVASIPDREDIQIIIIDNAPLPLRENQIPITQHAKVDYLTSSPEKGAGCARNEGLKYVQGAYLLFLDADDYFTPNAFSSFDNYLGKDFDIVFFKPTSIRLSDGCQSYRHKHFVSNVEEFIASKNDKHLRYRWEVPWSKLFRTAFIKEGGFLFDEIKVSNDAWFSLMTGHNAKKITADKSVVYVVTEGAVGQSLIKTVNKENALIRYRVSIRINNFLRSVGHYEMRIRLLGAIRIAFTKFGIGEGLRYLQEARKNHLGIF